jgi:nucleotide-binding universal stress UspA family protein
MKHFLVPTDFSEPADAAFAKAVELATFTGAKVTLFHVIYTEKINETLLGLDAMEYLTRVMNTPTEQAPYSPTLASERLRQEAEERLSKAIADKGGKAKVYLAVAEGRPSTEILDFIQKNDVDLVVMGTHGRGAIGKALLGSVADNVIRQADCPVMVVRK